MFAVVIYTNPLSEWFWESGCVFWVIGGIAAMILFALIVIAYIDLTRKK